MKKPKITLTPQQRFTIEHTLELKLRGYRADLTRLNEDDEYLKEHAILVSLADLFHNVEWAPQNMADKSMRLTYPQIAAICWALSDMWVYLRSNELRDHARACLAILYPIMPK